MINIEIHGMELLLETLEESDEICYCAHFDWTEDLNDACFITLEDADSFWTN